jgi:small subunit ribosomal protein S16
MGTKKRPIYRLVAIDSRRAREGRFIDQMGHYNPLERPATVTVDEEKIYKWLRDGAEPSQTVKSLFAHIGLNEKWELVRDGKDASGIELKTFITERKKKRKKTKAAVTVEAAEEPKEEAKEEPAAEAAEETPAADAGAAPAETEEKPAAEE